MRVILSLVCALWCNVPLRAQTAPPCSTDSAFGWLDFWLGHWDVYVGDTLLGRDDVQKILNGCAITESWTPARGQSGFRLFYLRADTPRWRQVWVTGSALARGGVKEKELVTRFPDGGVRFQGTIHPASGAAYLDRTTLTPLPGGRVHQVIEVSTDVGRAWQVTFDAIYVRRP